LSGRSGRKHLTGMAIVALGVLVAGCGTASANGMTVASHRDNHGEIGLCGSKSLKGAFETNVPSDAPNANGWIHVTNTGSEPCALQEEYPGVVLLNREGRPVEEADYPHDLPPAPTRVLLQPGKSATAEVRWSLVEPCVSIVWGADVTVLAGDQPMRLEPTKNGTPDNFSLCGGGTFHVGGFAKNG
jgi:hypothetical protein